MLMHRTTRVVSSDETHSVGSRPSTEAAGAVAELVTLFAFKEFLSRCLTELSRMNTDV